MIRYKFKGLSVLQNRLQKAESSLKDLDKIIGSEANKMAVKAKIEAPKKTGTLSSSISADKVESSNNKIIYEVGTEHKYGAFQDFGTGREFDRRPASYKEFDSYAKEFKGVSQDHDGVRSKGYFLKHFILSRRSLTTQYKSIMKKFYGR